MHYPAPPVITRFFASGRYPLLALLFLVRATSESSTDGHIRLGQYFLERKAPGRAVSEFEAAVRMAPERSETHYNLGVALRLWGDLQGAEAALRKALELQPRFPEAHFVLGLVLADRVGEEPAGKAEFEAAIAQRPNFADAHFNLGVIHWKENNVQLALESFQKAARFRPDSAEYRFRLGQALAQAGQPDKAVSELRYAVELDPAHARARYQFAIVLQKLGRPEEATHHRDILRRLQREGPRAVEKDHSHLAYQEGMAELQRGNIEGAIKKLTSALESAGSESMVRSALGIAYQRNGNLERAELELRRSIQLEPASVDAHLNLGTLLGRRGDVSGAIREFKFCIASDPNFAEAHYNLGLMLASQKRFFEAETALKRAIVLQPNHARAHWNLGRALRDAGDAAGALTSFREACSRDHSLTKAFLELGELLNSMDQTEEAIAVWSDALQRAPAHSRLNNLLARALEESGRQEEAQRQRKISELLTGSSEYRDGIESLDRGQFEKAAQFFRKLLDLHPDLGPVRRKLAFALFAKQEHGAAVTEFQRLLHEFPSDADLHLSLGLTLLQLNRLEESKSHLQEAARLNPHAAQAYFQLGMAYLAERDRRRALEQFHAARRIDPYIQLPEVN